MLLTMTARLAFLLSQSSTRVIWAVEDRDGIRVGDDRYCLGGLETVVGATCQRAPRAFNINRRHKLFN